MALCRIDCSCVTDGFEWSLPREAQYIDEKPAVWVNVCPDGFYSKKEVFGNIIQKQFEGGMK